MVCARHTDASDIVGVEANYLFGRPDLYAVFQIEDRGLLD
jgi:hypothetical protein